jgi:hypothetical protein
MHPLADDTNGLAPVSSSDGRDLRDALRLHEGRAAVPALHKRDDRSRITHSTGGPRRLYFGDGDAADGMYGSHFDREESYEDR